MINTYISSALYKILGGFTSFDPPPPLSSRLNNVIYDQEICIKICIKQIQKPYAHLYVSTIHCQNYRVSVDRSRSGFDTNIAEEISGKLQDLVNTIKLLIIIIHREKINQGPHLYFISCSLSIAIFFFNFADFPDSAIYGFFKTFLIQAL